jgi:glycosyltransferase involved in cell wall biosynthesis
MEVFSPKYFIVPRLSERFHARLVARPLKHVLRRINSDARIDLINSQWFFPDSVAVDLAARDMGIPHVATGLGSDVNRDMEDPAKAEQIRHALANCSSITVVAESLREILIEKGLPATKIQTIPNGVDVARFAPRDKVDARHDLGLAASLRYVLYVGRLSEEKGLTTLIAAFVRVAEQQTDVRLLLVGDGPMRAVLEENVKRLGLDGVVRFVGQTNHPHVPVWMNAADCFCLPSVTEGCPNVVLEALASGLPTIASAVGGVPDMVTQHAGILVPPEQPHKLAEALCRAIAREWNPETIAASVAAFSWEAAAMRYVDVYRRAVDDDRGKIQ